MRGGFGSDSKARLQRDKLLAILRSKQADALAWHTIKLNWALQTDPPWSIEVCSPVFIDGYYLPVTALETWEFARRFHAFPLTRAVADQVHNQVLKNYGNEYAIDYIAMGAVPLLPMYRGQIDPDTKRPYIQNPLYEYEAFWDSSALQATKYTSDPSIHTKGVNQGRLVSGIHKLWVLSTWATHYPKPRPKAVNFGQYYKVGKPGEKTSRASTQSPYLDKMWNVHQTLGNAHLNIHWDYSQLLQLMRNLCFFNRDTGQWERQDLREALLNGKEPVWDGDDPSSAESKKLTEEMLP